MIVHIDMDAFYASVEIRDDPKLAALPVVVGGSPNGRGVVSAASYEARRFGLHSAMPAREAIRLCPDVVFIKPRMDYYAAISRQIRDIFFRFTSLVEPLSLDEAFLDVSGSTSLFGSEPSIAAQIKKAILGEVGLIASAGVAPNKFLAKVASDLEKPDGLVIVDQDHIQDFLDPLPITRIWGIGRQGKKKFESLGIHTIRHLSLCSLQRLKNSFGINSEHFWRLARGIDSRAVVPDRDAKSISHETTFAADIADDDALSAWLLELTDQVAQRMRRYGIRGKTVQLKLRNSSFQTVTRSRTLSKPTHTTAELWAVGSEILREFRANNEQSLRLLGMGVSNLTHSEWQQQSLFEGDAAKFESLDRTTDQIRDRYGGAAVRSGTSLQHDIRHRPDPRVDDGHPPDKLR